MIRPRRLADIAKDLRRYDADLLVVRERLADELDAIDARWPSAGEIAELRALTSALLLDGRDKRIVERVLDKLDPPAPEPQADDDVDPWALLAAVVAPVASGADMPDRMAAVDAARAALDARRQS